MQTRAGVITPGPPPISGGSSVESSRDSAALRARVREWLARGVLAPPSSETWAGPGTGKLCAVCGLVVAASDLEFEVGKGAGRLYAHQLCYAIWAEEGARHVVGDGDGRCQRAAPTELPGR
jgi:hypothetical protein